MTLFPSVITLEKDTPKKSLISQVITLFFYIIIIYIKKKQKEKYFREIHFSLRHKSLYGSDISLISTF